MNQLERHMVVVVDIIMVSDKAEWVFIDTAGALQLINKSITKSKKRNRLFLIRKQSNRYWAMCASLLEMLLGCLRMDLRWWDQSGDGFWSSSGCWLSYIVVLRITLESSRLLLRHDQDISCASAIHADLLIIFYYQRCFSLLNTVRDDAAIVNAPDFTMLHSILSRFLRYFRVSRSRD